MSNESVEQKVVISETWFVLFDGSSEDGRGGGRYCGRTTNKEIARKHYEKFAKNPYSCGKVFIVTNESAGNADHWTDWGALQ